MPKFDAEGVGLRLAASRILRKMTQVDLIARCSPEVHLTQWTLTKMEMGKVRKIDMDVMMTIAKVLNVSVEYLLFGPKENDGKDAEDGSDPFPARRGRVTQQRPLRASCAAC